jgi:putative SOS response-associated peptidase YedK
VPTSPADGPDGQAGRPAGLSLFRWGFVPSWAEEGLKVRLVNAKAETVAATALQVI